MSGRWKSMPVPQRRSKLFFLTPQAVFLVTCISCACFWFALFVAKSALWKTSQSRRPLASLTHDGPSLISDSPKLHEYETGKRSTKSKSKNQAVSPRMRFILAGDVSGGLGNQIEILLQLLGLANKYQFEVSIPPVSTRFNDSTLNPSAVWNFDALKSIVPQIYPVLPPECDSAQGGKVDLRIRVNTKAQPGKGRIIVDQQSLERQTVEAVIDRYAFDEISDLPSEILSILDRSPDLAKEQGTSRHVVCLHLGIHAARANMSLAPFVIAHERYTRIAKEWPLAHLAVIHLRYDESRLGCGSGPPAGVDPLHHVCVVLNGVRETLWVPQVEYVDKVSALLYEKEIREVYLTKSPYMAEQAWKNLASLIQSRTKLLVSKSAAREYQLDELNFVEREIARNCKFFLSEARSTWSKTVVASRNDKASTMEAINLFL